MHGYWNRLKTQANAFRNGFFRTGDWAYQDAAGYFYIVDRVKDMIVTGGEKSTAARSRQSYTIIRQFERRLSSEYPIHSGANS